jgi:hypothetical protein
MIERCQGFSAKSEAGDEERNDCRLLLRLHVGDRFFMAQRHLPIERRSGQQPFAEAIGHGRIAHADRGAKDRQSRTSVRNVCNGERRQHRSLGACQGDRKVRWALSEREGQCDEQSQLRASLYRPLIALPKDIRAGVVDAIVANILS